MKIQIDPHAQLRAAQRGVTAEEIEETIRNGDVTAARGGRQIRSRVLACGKDWKGRWYPEKKVEVVCVEDKGAIIAVTVYAFYGRWSKE